MFGEGYLHFFASIKGCFNNRATDLHATLFPVQGEFLQFQGSSGMHHARTAARGSTLIREMRAHHTIMNPGLWVTQHRRARRTPFGLNVKGGEVSSPTNPAHSYYFSFQNWRQKPARYRNTAMHRPHTCSARYATQMLKPGKRGAQARQSPQQCASALF